MARRQELTVMALLRRLRAITEIMVRRRDITAGIERRYLFKSGDGLGTLTGP
jgi:hypothetical protein